MTRIEAWLALLVQLIIAGAGLQGCAEPQRPAASPASSAKAPASGSDDSVDCSSPGGFTLSMLAGLRQREPGGGWAARGPLELVNAKGFVVSLERIAGQCENSPSQRDAELAHFLDEAIRISTQERPPPATADRLVAVIRPAAYLDRLPSGVRSKTLSEPLAADLWVIYVVDEGGAVRGANPDDLATAGVTREALAAVARENLASVLSGSAAQPACEPHSVTLVATGNYFESSRLLLTDFWKRLADRNRSVVVAAPAADALVIACDPDATELRKLSDGVAKMFQIAERPVSKSLLRWTGSGWEQLGP